MDCGDKILQILIFIFNFIFFLSGIAVIVVGSLVIADENSYVALISNGVLQVSILLIVIGVIIMVITFFGCCGAMKQSKCMLYTYSALLCVIFICEFAGGISAFVYRADIKNDVTEQLNSTIAFYNASDPNNDYTIEWDNMQEALECCGAYNSSDWGEDIPVSCRVVTSNSTSDIYTIGCIDAAIETLDDNAALIGGIACGLAFVEILGIIFACCFATDIH